MSTAMQAVALARSAYQNSSADIETIRKAAIDLDQIACNAIAAESLFLHDRDRVSRRVSEEVWRLTVSAARRQSEEIKEKIKTVESIVAGLHGDIGAASQWAVRQLRLMTANYALDDDIFAEIAQTLEKAGCCHDHRHPVATPPMFYPEWIKCAIAAREKKIKELQESSASKEQRQDDVLEKLRVASLKAAKEIDAKGEEIDELAGRAGAAAQDYEVEYKVRCGEIARIIEDTFRDCLNPKCATESAATKIEGEQPAQ